MADRSSPEALKDALCDIHEALTRFVEANGAETHAEPNHVAAIVSALQRLALRHEADALADACEASAHNWGL